LARILHISCDFPDVLVSNKTQAIKRLVDGAFGHEHVVYSLNRVDGISGIEIIPFGKDRHAVAYRAPPKGILLKTRLAAVAKCILSNIRRLDFKFDLVHAHKLTIDGIVGHLLAKELDIPIAFSVQGDTDMKVMSARPDLAGMFQQHVKDATILFPFAPWTLKELCSRIPSAAGKCRILPVAPAKDDLSSAPVIGLPKLVSVFHLDSWRRKNLDGMARTIKALASQVQGIHLDVIGGGSAKSFIDACEAVQNAGADHLIRFVGPISNQEIAATLKEYSAFVLPTLRESYGLVHAEALFAGLPVVISRDMGIDGLLPECNFIATCNSRSIGSVSNAILSLLDNEAAAKASLAAAQLSGALDGLRKKAILDIYQDGLSKALRQPAHILTTSRIEAAA
jgi:glycosyltransferase involved in cell wall biosynthesis